MGRAVWDSLVTVPRVNLDDTGPPPLSRDAQAVLRELRRHDLTPSYPTQHSVVELSLRDLARGARLSVERARMAVEQLVNRGTPGLQLEGDLVVLTDRLDVP